jgi:predicted RNase H-like HicB family nuclease
MTVIHYPAIIERDGRRLSVFFPDLPGLDASGATLEMATDNAERALAAHLARLAERGETPDLPSDLDDVEGDDELEEVARILVRGELPTVV